MRMASFNVENLFARPKAMDQRQGDAATRKAVLAAHARISELFELPSYAGVEDEILAQLLGPDADELYDVESVRNTLFGGSAPLPIDTTFTAGAEIKAIQSTLTEEVMLGDRTVESWVSEATAQANAAIAKAE